MTKFIIALFAIYALNYRSFAQNLLPIQTDRPDQTECPFTVPKKHFQVENGFNFEKVSNDEKNYLYPTSLWKYGINDNLELRLVTELTTTTFNGTTNTGLDPVKIGFKASLWKESGLIPTTSLIAQLSIPDLSSQNLRTTYYAPCFAFAMQHSLTDKIDIGSNLGAKWDGETPDPLFYYTLVTGFELTTKFSAYIELYGFAPRKRRADHRMDGGIAYFLKPNILLDLSGGCGLTDNAPRYYFSLGFSLRLPD